MPLLATCISHEFTNSNQTLLRADGMPQLVPFFFVNEVTFAFGLLATLTYLSAKYILPRYPRLFLARLFISKL